MREKWGEAWGQVCIGLRKRTARVVVVLLDPYYIAFFSLAESIEE